MSQPPKRYDDYTITQALSLCPPAVRLLVIHAYADEGSDGTTVASSELLPVIAVRGTVEAAFSRIRRANDYRRPPTPEQAEHEGWTHETTTVECGAIVFDREFGVCPLEEVEAVNVVNKIVCAPWDPSEDAKRLAGVIAEVEAEALEKSKAFAVERAGAV